MYVQFDVEMCTIIVIWIRFEKITTSNRENYTTKKRWANMLCLLCSSRRLGP